MILKSEDDEVIGLLIEALYKVDDDVIRDKAYSSTKGI